MGTGRDGDSKENIQGPQSNFLLGSGTGFSRGRERRQAWRSEATELELHPDIGQPSLEGWSKRSYPEPLKRLAYLESEKRQQTLCPCKKANGGVLRAPWHGSPQFWSQAGTVCKH